MVATCSPRIKDIPMPIYPTPEQIIDSLVLQFGTAPADFIAFIRRAGTLSWRANCITGACSPMLRSLYTQRDMIKAALAYHQQLVDMETMREERQSKQEDAAQSTLTAAAQESEAAQGEFTAQATQCAATRQDSNLTVVFDSGYSHIGFTQYSSTHTTNENGSRQQDDISDQIGITTENYNRTDQANSIIQRNKRSTLDEITTVGHMESTWDRKYRTEVRSDMSVTQAMVQGLSGMTMAVGGTGLMAAAGLAAGLGASALFAGSPVAAMAGIGMGYLTGTAAGGALGSVMGATTTNGSAKVTGESGGEISHGEFSVGNLVTPPDPQNPYPSRRFSRVSNDTSASVDVGTFTDYTTKATSIDVTDEKVMSATLSKTWAITERGQTSQVNTGSSTRTRRFNADGEDRRDAQGSFARADEKNEQGTSEQSEQSSRQMQARATVEMHHNRNPWSQHWDALYALYLQVNQMVMLALQTITMNGRQYVSAGASTPVSRPPACGTVMGRR